MSLRVRRPNLPLRGIRVVEYPTEFPHREVLEQKQAAVAIARERLVGMVAAVCAEEFLARPSFMGCRNCDYGDLCDAGERGLRDWY